jgi:ABC-2 type transport system ATP-binding protein
MANAIRLTDVTKRFNGVAAVDGLTLAVPDGSIYGFIGPNGSGKTTTLRMIMHLLLPDQGQIEVLGTAATAAARDRVSYLPEERGLYKKMAVRRLLPLLRRLKGRSPRAARPRDRRVAARSGMGRLGARRRSRRCRRACPQKVQFVAAPSFPARRSFILGRAVLPASDPGQRRGPQGRRARDAPPRHHRRLRTHDMGTAREDVSIASS